MCIRDRDYPDFSYRGHMQDVARNFIGITDLKKLIDILSSYKPVSYTHLVTNMDGEFTIAVPQNSYLTVSYIGYETQKIAIGKQKLLRIVLKEENTLLNEVVVVGLSLIHILQMIFSFAVIKLIIKRKR